MGGVVVTSGQKKETTWIGHGPNEGLDAEVKEIDMIVSPLGLINNGAKPILNPEYKPTREEIERVINLPKEAAKIPDDIKKYVPTEIKVVPEIPILGVSYSLDNKFTIQEEIEQAEQHLADLKLKKKEEIVRRKAELAELEAE